ncbi:hypothetical protein H6F78_17040 [Coleofasciculus sp. FACHB-64]|uniref:hypothetical protein n=1 Tax=Cyanophyceae TaxID=3028117 RepID=UPI001685FB4C|nr:hypothetical protein [Coleofasciculus sp. FACHB-64]MBD2047277.1 hypothetical protein [Coleofasciculus sp. FACHB-64]
MSWITYKVVAKSGTTFTHFSRSSDLKKAQKEWEKKFNQKAKNIALDNDDTELDFSDLFDS